MKLTARFLIVLTVGLLLALTLIDRSPAAKAAPLDLSVDDLVENLTRPDQGARSLEWDTAHLRSRLS